MARGTLFLIVGPSGAGKDTLIAAARERLPGDRFAFVQRTITRPREAAGEDHRAVDARSFEAERRAGAFALSWEAHGLSYGIPCSIVQTLTSGNHVVANVSRTVVHQARDALSPVRVIEITAPPALLRERLQARNREDVGDRLSREIDSGADVTIVNDGPLAPAIAAFLAALNG